ncbi:hypothetical protein [Spirosoma terrae]|uniref:Uncharacterized protein n=1 Tax=Spirosoma terrae TaxID=1968276 RepID=A0A6L9LAZ4_9BACT|nr:hypothetical protein [Spirosoma terrae]NDU95618.1 hypothetical protein [Spirosoma terrae]
MIIQEKEGALSMVRKRLPFFEKICTGSAVNEQAVLPTNGINRLKSGYTMG